MKKILLLVLIVLIISTVFLSAQTREEQIETLMALPEGDFKIGIGLDMLESFLSSISMVPSLPLEFQTNLNGFIGISSGLTISSDIGSTIKKQYDSDTDTWIEYSNMDGIGIGFSIGPIFYFSGKRDDSIKGLFTRLRGVVEYVGPAIVHRLNIGPLSYGLELHTGYNFIFGKYPHVKYFMSPEIGARFMSYSNEIKLNIGLVFGNSF